MGSFWKQNTALRVIGLFVILGVAFPQVLVFSSELIAAFGVSSAPFGFSIAFAVISLIAIPICLLYVGLIIWCRKTINL